MAKKKEASEEQASGEQSVISIQYDDLMSARVRVVKDGVEAFYIDPARKLGEFVLRPIPQEAEEPGEVPEAWRKPTPEQAAELNPTIDWKIPGGDETQQEAEIPGSESDEEAKG